MSPNKNFPIAQCKSIRESNKTGDFTTHFKKPQSSPCKIAKSFRIILPRDIQVT